MDKNYAVIGWQVTSTGRAYPTLIGMTATESAARAHAIGSVNSRVWNKTTVTDPTLKRIATYHSLYQTSNPPTCVDGNPVPN